jgi:hypothetical protein
MIKASTKDDGRIARFLLNIALFFLIVEAWHYVLPSRKVVNSYLSYLVGGVLSYFTSVYILKKMGLAKSIIIICLVVVSVILLIVNSTD